MKKLIGLFLAVSACGLPDAEPEIASRQDEIIGAPVVNAGAFFPVVELAFRDASSTPRRATGVVVANDLVITSARGLSATTTSISVDFGHPGGNPATMQHRSGTHVNVHPDNGLAAVRLNQPLSLPVSSNTVSTSGFSLPIAAAPAAGTSMNCLGFEWVNSTTSNEALWSGVASRAVQVLAANGTLDPTFLDASTAFQFAADVGVPCLIDGPQLSGLVIGQANGRPRFLPAATIAEWIGDMKNLAAARGVASASYQLRLGNGLCMDVWGASMANQAPMQQFTCHGGANQRFYVVPHPSLGVRIINAHTGKCLDVPGGVTTRNTGLQQFSCHGGEAQAWQFFTARNNPEPWDRKRIARPNHLPRWAGNSLSNIHEGLCVQVPRANVNQWPPPANNTVGARLVQDVCIPTATSLEDAANQLWLF